MQTHALFPLMVAIDEIKIDSETRKRWCEIIQLQAKKNPVQGSGAWTGDTKNNEFLLRDPNFAELHKLISRKIYQYIDLLEINRDKVDLFFQRSWATYTVEGKSIATHTHAQSHISYAYYLYKPQNSGGIMFTTDNHPNEIAPELFGLDKFELSLIKKPNNFNGKKIMVDPQQDWIVIFPSKTKHKTEPNQSNKPRISISGDISIMLKESGGFEHLMPNFKDWQKVATD